MVELVPFQPDEFHLVPFNPKPSNVTIASKGGNPRRATPAEAALPEVDAEPERAVISPFGEFLITQIADNFLATPSAIADAFTVNPIEDARRLLRGEVPERVLGNTPRVTTADVGAGIRSVTDPDVSFGEAKQNIEQARAQTEAEFPVSTAAGKTVGDIFSLLAGRGAIGRVPTKATKKVTSGGLEGKIATGLNSIKRGAGKALEVGMEGALLATLQEGDPVKTAAAAGGAQAFGSLLLATLGAPARLIGITNPAGKFATNLVVDAAALTGLFQLFKSMTPGGRDFILDSAETAFNKIGLGMMLGAGVGLAGAGRVVGPQISTSFPKVADKVADAINVGLRGPWIEFWKNLFKASDEEAAQAERTLQDIMLTPGQFPLEVRKDLERDLRAGGSSLFQTLAP